VILWNILLVIAFVVAAGVALELGSSWTERVLLASVLCGIVVYAFYRLTGSYYFVR
jgi:hypothetical protein